MKLTAPLKCVLIVRTDRDVMQRTVNVVQKLATVDQVMTLLKSHDFRLETMSFNFVVSSPDVDHCKVHQLSSDTEVAAFFSKVTGELTFDITLAAGGKCPSAMFSTELLDDDLVTILVFPPLADAVNPDADVTEKMFVIPHSGVLAALTRAVKDTLRMDRTLGPVPKLALLAINADSSVRTPITDDATARKVLQENSRAGVPTKLTYTILPQTPRKVPIHHTNLPSPKIALTSDTDTTAVNSPTSIAPASPRPSSAAKDSAPTVAPPQAEATRDTGDTGALPSPTSPLGSHAAQRREPAPPTHPAPAQPLADSGHLQPPDQQQPSSPSTKKSPLAPIVERARTHQCDVRVQHGTIPSDLGFVFAFSRGEMKLLERFREECHRLVHEVATSPPLSSATGAALAVSSGGEQFSISNDGELREWMALARESGQPLRVHLIQPVQPPASPVEKSPRIAPVTAAYLDSPPLTAPLPKTVSSATATVVSTPTQLIQLPVLARENSTPSSTNAAPRGESTLSLPAVRTPNAAESSSPRGGWKGLAAAREKEGASPLATTEHLLDSKLLAASGIADSKSSPSVSRSTISPGSVRTPSNASAVMSATEVQLPRRSCSPTVFSHSGGGVNSQATERPSDQLVVTSCPLSPAVPSPQQQASEASWRATSAPSGGPPEVMETRSQTISGRLEATEDSDARVIVSSTPNGLLFQSFFRCCGSESLVLCELRKDSKLKDLKQAVCNEFGMPIRVDGTVRIFLHSLEGDVIDVVDVESDEVLDGRLLNQLLGAIRGDATVMIKSFYPNGFEKSVEVLSREVAHQLMAVLGHTVQISDLAAAVVSCKKSLAAIEGTAQFLTNVTALPGQSAMVKDVGEVLAFVQGILKNLPDSAVRPVLLVLLTRLQFLGCATPQAALQGFLCWVFSAFPRRTPLQKNGFTIPVTTVVDLLKWHSLDLPDRGGKSALGDPKEFLTETEFCSALMDLFASNPRSLLNCISVGVMEGKLCLRNHRHNISDEEYHALERLLQTEIQHCFDGCSVEKLEEFIQDPETAKNPVYDVLLSVVGALLAPQPTTNYTQWIVDHFKGKLTHVLFSKIRTFTAAESLSAESLYAATWAILKPDLTPCFQCKGLLEVSQLYRWAFFVLQSECLARRTTFPPVPPYDGVPSSLTPISSSPILIAGVLGRVSSGDSKVHRPLRTVGKMKKGKVQYKYRYTVSESPENCTTKTKTSASQAAEA